MKQNNKFIYLSFFLSIIILLCSLAIAEIYECSNYADGSLRKIGDINKDKLVNNNDSLILFEILANASSIQGSNVCADVNKDGVITTNDFSQLSAAIDNGTDLGTVPGGGGNEGGGGDDGGSHGGGTCIINCTGKTCGTYDGCSGRCRDCPTGKTCNTQTWKCEEGSCIPETCASLGKNCGSQDDGCGASLDCGTCNEDESCISDNCVKNETPNNNSRVFTIIIIIVIAIIIIIAIVLFFLLRKKHQENNLNQINNQEFQTTNQPEDDNQDNLPDNQNQF